MVPPYLRSNLPQQSRGYVQHGGGGLEHETDAVDEMLSFRIDVVQQQTQPLPIQHRAHRCMTRNWERIAERSPPTEDIKYLIHFSWMWIWNFTLTLKCIFKEFLRKVSAPFVLATSCDLFVNSGYKIFAHLVQQRHEVGQYLWRNHLLVENDAVRSPVLSIPVESSEVHSCKSEPTVKQ